MCRNTTWRSRTKPIITLHRLCWRSKRVSPGNRCRVLDVSERSQTFSQHSPSVEVFSSQQCPCHRKSPVLMSCVLFSLVYNSSAPRSLTLSHASSVITVSSSTIIRWNSARSVTFYLTLDYSHSTVTILSSPSILSLRTQKICSHQWMCASCARHRLLGGQQHIVLMAYSPKAYHGYNIYLLHRNIAKLAQSQMKPWMWQMLSEMNVTTDRTEIVRFVSMPMSTSRDWLLYFRSRHEMKLNVNIFVSKYARDDRCMDDETILADGAKTKAITLHAETGYCSALNISNP